MVVLFAGFCYVAHVRESGGGATCNARMHESCIIIIIITRTLAVNTMTEYY